MSIMSMLVNVCSKQVRLVRIDLKGTDYTFSGMTWNSR